VTPIALHRTYALGAFRWSVFFVFAIAAFSERDAHTRSILVAVVFLLDVVSWHLCEAVSIVGNSIYQHVWFDTLTNRFVFEKATDRVKRGQPVDVPALIKEGTAAAVEDLERFVRDGTYSAGWGGFKKTLHGIGYFLWWWISYGIFYGLAAVVGESMRSVF
jgi:hypothetical protein